jgi:membrane-associated protein
MEIIVDAFHLLQQYLDPRTIVAAGYFVLILVVFAETGLLIGFFLPGDSLLVVAGLYAANGDLNVLILLSTLCVAAVVGDAVGFLTGAKLGPKIFTRPKSLFFRPDHLHRAHTFYEKYGGKTIIIARFVPIVRTFAPIVAGAAQMSYRQFVIYNIVGAFLWVFSMILTGYFLGRLIPGLDHYIEWIALTIIILSIMPLVVEFIKARRAKATL